MQKRASEARKKQKVIEVKEIKLRPNIDSHDYDVKMRAVQKFLAAGDKVKITLKEGATITQRKGRGIPIQQQKAVDNETKRRVNNIIRIYQESERN